MATFGAVLLSVLLLMLTGDVVLTAELVVVVVVVAVVAAGNIVNIDPLTTPDPWVADDETPDCVGKGEVAAADFCCVEDDSKEETPEAVDGVTDVDVPKDEDAAWCWVTTVACMRWSRASANDSELLSSRGVRRVVPRPP